MNTLAVHPKTPAATGRAFKLFALALGVIGVIGVGVWLGSRGDAGSEFQAAPKFELVDSNGASFSSEALKGKVWLASFFFTSCTSVCPMVIGQMNTLFETVPPQIHFVSFSVDPTNDTPAALKKYADKFDADTRRWHFLTGTQDQLREVVQNGFHVSMPASAAELDRHSVRFVLVDQTGAIRGYFDSTDKEDLARLKEILEVYRSVL